MPEQRGQMRIEIDTNKDSPHDIRKAIRLLLSLVGNGTLHETEPAAETTTNSRNIFDNPTPTATALLDDTAPTQSTPTTQQPAATGSSSPFGALFDSMETYQSTPTTAKQSTTNGDNENPPADTPEIEVY